MRKRKMSERFGAVRGHNRLSYHVRCKFSPSATLLHSVIRGKLGGGGSWENRKKLAIDIEGRKR